MTEYRLSETRACILVGISRSYYHYKSRKKEDPLVVREILITKERRPYYGVPRVLETLRRKGITISGKRVYRIMKMLNLLVVKKRKRRKWFVPVSLSMPHALRVGDVWSIDFVFDRLENGDSFRCFTIVDILSREVPGIFASKSMSGFSPVDFLEELKSLIALPKHIILDNGTEFANSVFVEWCRSNGINLHFIDPGKPVQNAYIESFNGKFRTEFLSQKRFKPIAEVRSNLKTWIKYYNEERPHSSLDYLTPKEFAQQEAAVLENKKYLPVLKTG